MFEKYFDKIDITLTQWMAKYGLVTLRVGLGIIFFWFGALMSESLSSDNKPA